VDEYSTVFVGMDVAKERHPPMRSHHESAIAKANEKTSQ
jgi:hypothetical protein